MTIHQALDLVNDSHTTISHRCNAVLIRPDDPISRLLLNHVHQLYLEIDIHLCNAGLTTPLEHRLLQTRSKTDLTFGTVQETTSSSVYPLQLENADSVIWRGLTTMKHSAEPEKVKLAQSAYGSPY